VNKIIQGDALEVLKTIASESVDCCVTSPPYNKNGFRGKRDQSKGKGRWGGADISYGDFKDDMDENEYKIWQVSILNELYRILKTEGSMFYNHKIRRADHRASHPFEWVSKSKFNFYQQIIWDRLGGPDHNIEYLDPTTELIFWLTKGIPKVYKTNKNFSTEIWRIPPELGTKHPAPFPVTLVKACVLLTTQKGDVVIDPFSGSGTVGVVCKEFDRNYILIELNPEYIEMAENRLNNTQRSML
jgi:site-specific DNA-methyltransferase (adenine-specific)